MTAPTLSFVIPVYGTERYLRRCLDSVLAQTAPNWEAIVVDDASPGNCREIVESYADGRIRYVRHDVNRSLLQARITGLRAASGEFIVPLDSDDYVRPGLVRQLTEAVRRDVDIVVYQSDVDDGSRVRGAWHNARAGRSDGRAVLARLLRQELCWCVWGKAFRRTLYAQAVGEIPDSLYLNSTEDLCQMVPMLQLGGRVEFVAFRGYVYFQNPDSLSKRWMSETALAECARQNRESVAYSVDFVRRHGADARTVEAVANLDLVTIEWLLSLADDGSSAAWSANANVLCRVYGLNRVLRVLNRKYPQFLLRFRPDAALCASLRKAGEVRRMGVVCQRGFGGGAERVTKVWARAMIETGRQLVWLCAPEYAKEMRDLAAADGIEVVCLRALDDGRADELERICRERRLDAVLLVDHWKEQTLRDLLWLKSLDLKVVVAEHSAYFFPLDNLDVPLFVERGNAYRLADAVTALSPVNVAWWRAAGLGNAVYMPNFLPFEVADVEPVAVEERQAKRDFLCVGRICERKGAKQVLEAFRALLARDFPGRDAARLVFLGRFETEQYRRELLGEVERLGLSSQVVFPGEVSSVRDYLREAFALVSASRIEGAPVTFAEAKAYGLPVVAFALPFVEGMDEASGTVAVAQGDVSGLADALYGCLADASRYRDLSNGALASLAAFRKDRIQSRWQQLLSVIEEAGPVPAGCELPAAAEMLPLTMNAVHDAVRPLLACGFSAALTTESLAAEAFALVANIRRKFRDKIAEFGVFGVVRRVVYKVPTILRAARHR